MLIILGLTYISSSLRQGCRRLSPFEFFCCIYNDTHQDSPVGVPLSSDDVFLSTTLVCSLCGYEAQGSFALSLTASVQGKDAFSLGAGSLSTHQ